MTTLINVLATRRGGWWLSAKAATRIFRNEGLRGLTSRLEMAKFGTRVCHGLPSDADYVNILAAARSSVLLSDGHVRLLDALGRKGAKVEGGPTLGLSIVTYNSVDRVTTFLAALLSQTFPPSNMNIAIVDCGSTDGTLELLEEHLRDYGACYASFTIHGRTGSGRSQAHDHAIRLLSDAFVWVLSPAVTLDSDTIARTVRTAWADDEDVATWELRQDPDENAKYYDPVTLEALWSCHRCVLVRRAAYLQVGGYDSRLQGHGEDVDLSYRLRGSGWRLRYLPQIPVTYHVEPTDARLEAMHWSRSVSVNVLLRHRFAASQVAAEGEALLSNARSSERALDRRQALTKAQEIVERDRRYFRQTMRPERQVPFPFSGFGYVMSRQGVNLGLQPDVLSPKKAHVTVVTRTHGPRVPFLREAITSILNQTYPVIEHLVIEDRTDFAEDLVGEVASIYGSNIRYLKSSGPGRSAAGNLGLANASGEFIMFLDDDDLVFPDHVELLVRSLERYPQLVGAYTLAWEVHTRVDEQGGYREVMHELPGSQLLDFDRTRLATANFIPIQSMLFRRGLFESAGGFREDLDHLEDWDLWRRYAQHGDFMLVRKVTSLYRTPAEPEIRARRQAELDKAYDRVRLLNDQSGT